VDLEPDAPDPLPAEAPPPQAVSVIDDGTCCRVELVGGKHMRRAQVDALLAGVGADGTPFELGLQQPAEVGGGGRIVVLTFPSLHAGGLPTASLRLRLEYGAPSAALYDQLTWVDRVPPKGKPH